MRGLIINECGHLGGSQFGSDIKALDMDCTACQRNDKYAGGVRIAEVALIRQWEREQE